MNYQPKNILVTGGAGFIGSNFIHDLQKNPAHDWLINLDRLSTGGDKRNLEGMENADRHLFVQGDVADQALVTGLLEKHEIDTVVHFAAESHVDRSITDPLAFVQANVIGTMRLLEAVASYWLHNNASPGKRNGTPDQSVRFHHISTDEVYGSLLLQDPAFTELTRYDPHSPYAASKAASDHLVRAWRDTYGLPVTITNCSNNYGPHQHREKLIPTVIRACLQNKKIPVYGDGKNRRDWLYVLDHCLGVQAVIQRGKVGQTYNLGGESELSNNELVEKICLIMDEIKPGNTSYHSQVEYVTDRPGHDWRYAMDITKARAELGWCPTKTIEQGLRMTCQWYLDNPHLLD